jgi:hypothetical protein
MQPPPIGIPYRKNAMATGIVRIILQKKSPFDAGFHIVHIDIFYQSFNFGMLRNHIPHLTHLPLNPSKKVSFHIPWMQNRQKYSFSD